MPQTETLFFYYLENNILHKIAYKLGHPRFRRNQSFFEQLQSLRRDCLDWTKPAQVGLLHVSEYDITSDMLNQYEVDDSLIEAI